MGGGGVSRPRNKSSGVEDGLVVRGRELFFHEHVCVCAAMEGRKKQGTVRNCSQVIVQVCCRLQQAAYIHSSSTSLGTDHAYRGCESRAVQYVFL